MPGDVPNCKIGRLNLVSSISRPLKFKILTSHKTVLGLLSEVSTKLAWSWVTPSLPNLWYLLYFLCIGIPTV